MIETTIEIQREAVMILLCLQRPHCHQLIVACSTSLPPRAFGARRDRGTVSVARPNAYARLVATSLKRRAIHLARQQPSSIYDFTQIEEPMVSFSARMKYAVLKPVYVGACTCFPTHLRIAKWPSLRIALARKLYRADWQQAM